MNNGFKLELLQSNIDRIDNNRVFETHLAKGPNCNKSVYPKFSLYPGNQDSFLRWCNQCYKGKARIFWRYL